jgi:outer membrane lipoprotein-sorting protein
MASMRSLALFLGGAVLLGYAAQTQTPNLPAPLANNLSKLSSASSVNVKYTFRVVGESPTEYTLALGRPKMFKLSSDSGFIQSDGKTIYTYTKSSNTYTEAPLTDEALAEFAKRPEVFAWSPFLLKEPAADIAMARAGASRNVAGKDVTEVEVTMKKGSTIATLYVDKALGIARGYALKAGDKQYLVTATEVAIKNATPTENADATLFAFAAPSGAKKAEAVKATATYAQVQAIMNSSCMPCHNATNMRAGLNLTTYEGIASAVTPGNAAASRLIRSLHAPGGNRMPKNGAPLPEATEAVIAAWINAGAKKE